MNLLSLKNNISESKKIIKDLRKFQALSKNADAREKKFYSAAMESMFRRLAMLNNAIPSLLDVISANKPLANEIGSQKQEQVVRFSYSNNSVDKNFIAVNKEDKDKFLKELSLADSNIKKLGETKKQFLVLDKPSVLAKISSGIFGRISESIAANSLADLKQDLRESNSRFLLTTYLSIAFFISSCIFLGSLLAIIIVGLFYPAAFMLIWVPFLFLFLSFVGYYIYPALQKSSLDKQINLELPFATIYMSAIAGSNIEPTKIFNIIVSSPEYPAVGREIRKIINQVEVYGYDLVNALKNVAKSTTNRKLGELLNGMATNIVSGGSLKNFLEKKAENLLTDYKIEREKYNSIAGTFMDIYISVLITAPLILVMLIVIMGMTGLGFKLGTNTLVFLSIGAVILINIIFLIFLQIKQPKI